MLSKKDLVFKKKRGERRKSSTLFSWPVVNYLMNTTQGKFKRGSHFI